MDKKYVLILLACGIIWIFSITPAASDTPAGSIQKNNTAADKMTHDSTKVTLAEGLKVVTSESHVVKVARQDEAIAESDSLIARARLLPSVNASAS
ncbi:MAG TPA: hypothetical protein VFG29_06635, partial [Syntrophales bacterium]|nr:hypothetical protein [Syntrophales bacterium]